VENVGCCFGKKVENGVFFCKKVDLSSTQGALCTVSVFFILHFIYLGVRTQTFYVKIKYDGVIVAQCNYSVLQKKYHPSSTGKFNGSCPIREIFGTAITE